MTRRFDTADYRSRYVGRNHGSHRSDGPLWPVPPSQVQRTGDTITPDRDGHGRPHRGLDIFAEAGTVVLAALDGLVARVVDGRFSQSESTRRAGLFVDVRGSDGRVYRYLHLGESMVRKHQSLRRGERIGVIAAPFTSGLSAQPHLHFEIRETDFHNGTYGPEVDPLRLLPALRA